MFLQYFLMIFYFVLVFMSTLQSILTFLFFQYVLLGAVPFPTDVPRLKALGVGGVVTLNEPYETLVPTSLYHVSLIYSYSSCHFTLLLFKNNSSFLQCENVFIYCTCHLTFPY